MDKQQLINKVKQLTGDANLEEALDLLDEFTAPQRKYDDLHDQVVQAQALLSQTQRDQNAGVISFENAKLNFSQVTRQILDILDQLEKDEEHLAGKVSGRRMPVWLVPSIAVAVVAAIGGVWWYLDRQGSEQPEEQQDVTQAYCKGLDGLDADFRVLILPYLFISRPLGSHDLVRLRLGELRDQYHIKLESEVYGDSALAGNKSDYPANADKAAAFGEKCKADLVIWGTEEAQAAESVITTRYKFLVGKNNFELTKLKISDTGVDTVQSLSSILTQGAVTGEIEQIIKYLFGLIKFESGEYNEAIAALEEARIKESDSTAFLTKNMLLSDSYLKKGDEEMAMKSLDAALSTHREYALALNNRAALLYKRKQYEAAAADLEVANVSKPEDTTIVSNRLYASLAVEKPYIAQETVNKLKQIAPQNRDWTAKTPIIDSIKLRQTTVIDSTRAILQKNPRNMDAMEVQAQTYLNQGLFDDAIRMAKEILRQNPRNKTAYIILLEAFTQLQREKDIRETLKRIRANGLREDDLLSERNDLRILIDRITAPAN